MTPGKKPSGDGVSSIEFQVLLVLADAPSYGYAIMKAVRDQTEGRLHPEIGSLYRVLSRLMSRGLLAERSAPDHAPTNPRGLPRKYYGLTPSGARVASDEAEHLAGLLALARSRKLLSPRP